MTIEYVLWAFMIGVAIATVYTFYTKRILGTLVRKLIAIDACSPETAISLEQLNYKLNSAVRYSLRKGTSFSDTVLIDDNGNYYINPRNLNKAKIQYRNEGTSVYLLLVTLVVLLGVALISTYIYPQVAEKFREFINSLID